MGIVEIECGQPRRRFGLAEARLPAVTGGQRLIVSGLRRRLPGDQLLLPLKCGLRLLQCGARPALGGLRLVELELIGLGINGKEQRALLDQVAVPVVDLRDEARHPRHQVGGIHRHRVAGRLKIARHRLLRRHRHAHPRRRRRYIMIVPPAAGEQQHRGGARDHREHQFEHGSIRRSRRGRSARSRTPTVMTREKSRIRRTRRDARPPRLTTPAHVQLAIRRGCADIGRGRLAVDGPLANRVRSGRKQP